ncbi:P-loop NTPase family protein [Halorarum salinum]|uniref:DNA recombination and repair protein Rad51-like C-terminal domain-containing protein n=1 Tax=Halorarum salinum TaxID=2743089 RepID=A0A7D5QDZ4_9EURY|nr:hypothetical protein [Halobaculum salinum]QLG60343.1 hypothetical protein HUG12_00650 [Halobaculum salinum]
MHTRRHPSIDLPTLDTGVTLLQVDPELGLDPLHTLVVDELLGTDGSAVWIDARGHAQSSTLWELVPHQGYLDRIHVARGHTPWQHAALLDRLPTLVDDSTRLVVAPAVDGFYRTDDIPQWQAEGLLVRRLATLAGVSRTHDVPVLLTRTAVDEFSEPIATAAHHSLECTDTRFGPRFEGDGHETLVYPEGDGWVQTTITFWCKILEHRAKRVGEPVEPVTPTGHVTATSGPGRS